MGEEGRGDEGQPAGDESSDETESVGIGARPLQALHDLGDLDLGLADLAAAEVEEHGGAAQLLGQAVDVDLLPLDALEDAFQLVHRRPEAQGLAGLRRSLSWLAHASSTRLLKSPPATRVVTR